MKKLSMLILLVVTSVTFLFSCDKDNENQINTDEKQSFSKKTIGEDSIVGEIDAEGNFILLKDTVSLLENWNYNLLTYYEIDANLTSLSFFKDDIGEIYLRAKGEDYSSTTALTVINQSFLQGEGISCTSNTCSNSSTECVPKKDKLSCTGCGLVVGDCTKSVTAVAIFEKRLAPSEIL